MEKDVAEAIETTAPTNNEKNKDLCVAVELNTGEGGDPDKRPVIIRFRYISIPWYNNNKNQSGSLFYLRKR